MSTKRLLEAAFIAAIYAVLTVALSPISYGVFQVRIAEALTVLPMFTPAAIPGLFVGCLLSNLISPIGLVDMICGSLATLAAASCSYFLRKKPLLVPLPPVIVNGVVIGLMLRYVYAVPLSAFACMCWVALGELAACYVIGYPLGRYLEKHGKSFRK